jgi:hypothetical protein
MKITITFHTAWLLASCAIGLATNASAQNFHLPETDSHYKRTSAYVEEVPAAEYQHGCVAKELQDCGLW